MHSQNWNDALTLLCMMIMADGKVYQEEVQAFRKAAVQLRDAVSPEIMVTEKMAHDWFVLHKDNISQKMSSVYVVDATREVFNRLKPLPNKKELIVALMKIALSDGHQHHAENKIMLRACEAWDLDPALVA